MNIFVLDTDPRTAAQLHCDTHVVKMILETTQILCTVRHMAGNPVPGGYKPTHQHHPCTKWAEECVENYCWTWRLLWALHEEYEHRYHKVHASRRLVISLNVIPIGTKWARTPFVFAGPDSCIRPTIVESYRALYRLKQTTMKVTMRWTNRPRPEWMGVPIESKCPDSISVPYPYTPSPEDTLAEQVFQEFLEQDAANI